MTLYSGSDTLNQRVSHSPLHFLYRMNPLAKVFATLPAMIWVIFTRDLGTPIALIALALLLILAGARLSWGLLLTIFVIFPLVLAVLSFSFGIWVDSSLVEHTPLIFELGPIAFYQGSLIAGLTTGSRLLAIVVMALPSGLTTSGQDLVRSLIRQLRVPYRVGYTALAAQRFVPRFRYELELIQSAHRVRGLSGGRGPIGAIRRAASYLVPLLASAIRHAERVALAMDSRAFGAYATRTERHIVAWRMRDTVFVIVYWLLSIAIFIFAPGIFGN
ncbi:MAG: energy-coupling factor transporter transmembrane component T [Microbacteriaceae bacterium]